MPLPVRRKRGGALDPRRRVPPPPDDEAEATLQLAIARDGVGLELSREVPFGPVTLTHARSRLIGVGFPLDVSGGVERFRHRRTTLEAVSLAIEHAAVERWLCTLSEGLVARGPAEARIAWVAPPDAGIGDTQWAREEAVVWSSSNVRIELASEGAMVAFDLAFAAVGSGLSALAHRVRAIGAPRPPTAIVGALLARIARAVEGHARGLRLDLPDPSKLAVVQAFVVRGARVPTREDLVVRETRAEVERFEIDLGRGATPAAPSSVFVGLDELDRLIGDADAALVVGDVDHAREGYLHALDRAPRHRAILARLAEVDAYTGERAEAALSWLRDARRGKGRRGLDGNDLGRTLLAAALDQRVGAHGRARAAWERAGNEAFERGESRLAARAWVRAAALASDQDPQVVALLDRALVADPSGIEARWRRARLAILDGDDDRALEDVQHLEAQAKGREARRRTLMRAASLWLEAGRPDRAVPAWERALRHAPEDRAILAGLGSSLLSAGESARGIALLAHAAGLPGDEPGRAAILLDLAHALAERAGDLPAAVARLRGVPDADPRAAHARALEGVCRLQLGDIVGAELAWARAADHVEHRPVPETDARVVRELLLGAAKFVRDEGRAALAMRLGMSAVKIAPTDADARAFLQGLGRYVAEQSEEHDDLSSTGELPLEEPTTDPGLVEGTPIASAFEAESDDEPQPDTGDEARAEALLARVKADPNDHEAVDALVDVLGRLGRDMELFALLSARWEDATPEEREAMVPKQRAVLERLADAAEAQGRVLEAQLFRDALSMLPS